VEQNRRGNRGIENIYLTLILAFGDKGRIVFLTRVLEKRERTKQKDLYKGKEGRREKKISLLSKEREEK